MKRGSSLNCSVPLAKANPERMIKRRKQYGKRLSAMQQSGIRTAVLLRAEFRCELCGYEPEHWTIDNQIRCPELQIHPIKKQYKGFGGDEDLAKVKALCRWCHQWVRVNPDLDFPVVDPAIGMEPVV